MLLCMEAFFLHLPLRTFADGMAEWLARSALRVQTCIAMMTLSRAGGHGFDPRGRLLQGRFLWFPFFSGECRSRYQAIAYRSLVPKLPQHRPVGLSRGGPREEERRKKQNRPRRHVWHCSNRHCDETSFMSDESTHNDGGFSNRLPSRFKRDLFFDKRSPLCDNCDNDNCDNDNCDRSLQPQRETVQTGLSTDNFLTTNSSSLR